ncbi:MAG: S4 domain-containing protein [Atribacterota bacterium]|nr:S4 domain-containing protein [Atribacterota bacterium]MDD4896718.1 S4 domain-containing protein [Atribacterota bacterium]MDD5636579.1 S4 domain-containing protein [Atribacterota bacterium]
MRIDKFLKKSRVIKRRTEAKYACDNNCVKINGKIAKAGDTIKVFDKIEIQFRHKILEIEVLKIPNGNISVLSASQLYRIRKEEKINLE